MPELPGSPVRRCPQRGVPPILVGAAYLLLAALASPWILGRLVSPEGSVTAKVQKATLVLALGLVALAVLLLSGKWQPGRAFTNLLFLAGWFGILVMAGVGLDRLYGRLQGPVPGGLLMPPGSEAVYESPEFKFTAQINQLGIRDHDTPLVSTHPHRVLAVGDSFTFGWGVALDEGWVKLLEKRLRAAGVDAEVLNLGRGGADPLVYETTVRSAAALLKPGLIVVAVLEGDDMEQLLEARDREQNRVEGKGPSPGVRQAAWGFLTARLYPNFSRGRGGRREIAAEWRRQVVKLTNELTGDARRRLDELDPEVRSLFLAGGLNPGWLQLSLHNPGYFESMSQLDSPAVQRGIKELTGCLANIRTAAQSAGAKVLVLAVPHRAYMTPSELLGMRKLGFTTTPGMLTSGGATAAIRKAASEAGVEFAEVDEDFRRAAGKEALYFAMDSHFTRTGNVRFAELVEPIVRGRLSAAPPTNSGAASAPGRR